jgi:hypothetical protein
MAVELKRCSFLSWSFDLSLKVKVETETVKKVDQVEKQMKKTRNPIPDF